MIRSQFILDISDELIVDGFAGGGGMSTAIEQATGRHVDKAFNHAEDALSMHRMNHPQTDHQEVDMREVCPRGVTRGRRVGHFHMSPDCTDHSQAKAGQPRDKKIRGLTWVGLRWAGQASPRVITLENVKQILRWGRLIAKRCKETGRVVKVDGTVAAAGERVAVAEQHLVGDPRHAGHNWRRFVAELQRMGYAVEWRIMCAADYGAPTTRERLFMVARRDGQPIVWPAPTHAKKPARGLKKWRAAAECMDFSLPCRSIFERKKPLAEATLKRIAEGVRRYVLECGDPFIIPVTHVGDERAHDIREPLRTITGARRGEFALIAPSLAFLAQSNGGKNGNQTYGRDLRQPASTLTGKCCQQQLVNCALGSGPTAEENALRVAGFLMRYYKSGGQWADLRDPLHTVTVKERLALVTVTIRGMPLVVVDIGLRMLTARELYNAQGFPPGYIIDRGHDGRVFSKEAQVRMVGNSVSPPPARALIAANLQDLCVRFQDERRELMEAIA